MNNWRTHNRYRRDGLCKKQILHTEKYIAQVHLKKSVSTVAAGSEIGSVCSDHVGYDAEKRRIGGAAQRAAHTDGKYIRAPQSLFGAENGGYVCHVLVCLCHGNCHTPRSPLCVVYSHRGGDAMGSSMVH